MTVYLGTDGNEFILHGKQREVNAEEVPSPLTTLSMVAQIQSL
jgi:sterol 14alpha-demethylase